MIEGQNGAYAICCDCGLRYGTNLHKAMGMWQGTCAICGEDKGLTDAWHDWRVTDEHVEDIIALRDGA